VEGGLSSAARFGGVEGGLSSAAKFGGVDGGLSSAAKFGGVEGGLSSAARAELAIAQPATKATKLIFILMLPD
jgi:hypothetical protein